LEQENLAKDLGIDFSDMEADEDQQQAQSFPNGMIACENLKTNFVLEDSNQLDMQNLNLQA
jgi:hypothetical protein